MDDEYAYGCSTCRKTIKSNVVKCKTCAKLFYHPECVNKHKILDKNQEYVPFKDPFDKFLVDGEQDTSMRKALTMAGRDRTSSTGSIRSTGFFTTPRSGSKELSIDVKVDWIIKTKKK